ncbi:MAG: hypothetical protein PVH50_10725 [Anaerolineae bacterium]
MSTSPRLEMSLSSAHRNRYLFSDHFLDHVLPNDPRWEEGLAEVKAFLAWLQRRCAREGDALPGYRERALEAHWFRPILRQLGHVFEPEPAVPGLGEGVKRPDYIFFPDHAARREAADLQEKEAYAQRALAVGEVLRWGGRLGKKRKGGEGDFADRNPSWQIDYYLRSIGVDWGILSNGRLWRLVHRDSSDCLDVFYEIDLIGLLQEPDPGVLRYFTLFFRQEAFQPDHEGRVFLDDVMTASEACDTELEEDLRENAHRALERLIRGFLDRPANQLGADDLKEVYDNSLYLLYRLLFILFGESRGLLPLDYEQYHVNHSLARIKEGIARRDVPPAAGTTLYWGQLKNLFQIINGSYPKLNSALHVPRYNGGLFDPRQHPFLEEKEVGDRALAAVIDLLSRRETDAGRVFVDYGTLGIRRLAAVFEGLLECHPRFAEEPVVAVEEDGEGRWVKEDEAPVDARVIERRERGQVYLATDEGRRRPSRSHDTPRPVVEAAVRQAVGPLVREIRERVDEQVEAADAELARSEARQTMVEEVLALKILDPAMGSGRYLVEATEFVALALATSPYVSTEATPEDDLSYWKRRVVERSIYGVDRNPLAVELAKLSLWLATVAADCPLSFLDHHLKCGDALIGARVEDLGWAPPPVLDREARRQAAQHRAGQINMLEHLLSQALPAVMGRILEITEEESRDYDAVQAKEEAAHAVQDLKLPFDAVADLWTSAYFGNAFARGDYDEALGVISKPDTLLGLEAVNQARHIAEEHRFFHWELVFPEVFYDDSGRRRGKRAGFDGLVGSARFGGGLSEDEIAFLDAIGFQAGDDDDPLLRFFTERGLELLVEQRRLAFVVPNACLGEETYRAFRERISGTGILCWIQDFQDFNTDAGGPSCILLLKAGAPAGSYLCNYLAVHDGDSERPPDRCDLRVDPGSGDPWLPGDSVQGETD